MVKLYYVGGYVRDTLLHKKPTDIDIAVEANSYEEMRKYLITNGYTIFLEKPEYFTIRAKDPINKINNKYITADFVLCRKEGYYYDGRHPDNVEIGNLYDDCSRRDFTINSIAIDVNTGGVIDYFNGIEDINNKIIRCVGYTYKRFNEDCLRILRAIRFSITLGFEIDINIIYELQINKNHYSKMLSNIPIERIQNELYKMLDFDTYKTMNILYNILPCEYRYVILNNKRLFLKPILKG
jgi:tRNA nucleotidyltransferase (CCA-adding enzyme)